MNPIDFTKYSNQLDFQLENVINIGWSINFNASNKTLPSEFLNNLKQIIFKRPVNIYKGNDTCKICNNHQDIFIYKNEERVLLGHYEIWVPSYENDDIIYASPSLIYHYIDFHNYYPPESYIESVLNFDINSKWDGEKTRFILINKYS